jgi:hypothetical protein
VVPSFHTVAGSNPVPATKESGPDQAKRWIRSGSTVLFREHVVNKRQSSPPPRLPQSPASGVVSHAGLSPSCRWIESRPLTRNASLPGQTVDYFVTRGRQSRTTLAPEIGWPLPGVLGVRSLGST